jgi:DNA-binding CsgD family transcriptional regulator
MTTREAAAALFLSPKTIEYHLRSIYRKLDVRSRPALADALAGRRPRPEDANAVGGRVSSS